MPIIIKTSLKSVIGFQRNNQHLPSRFHEYSTVVSSSGLFSQRRTSYRHGPRDHSSVPNIPGSVLLLQVSILYPGLSSSSSGQYLISRAQFFFFRSVPNIPGSVLLLQVSILYPGLSSSSSGQYLISRAQFFFFRSVPYIPGSVLLLQVST